MVRQPSVRLASMNTEMKKYLNKASLRGMQLGRGIPTQNLDGWDSILLDYEDYAISIGNDDYQAMDAVLDYIIN
jgi:hypothetical protein